MNVIIAGGTGMIGRALTESLVRDGHEVTVLSRNPERKDPLLPAEVELAGWDAQTSRGWAELVESADAILNFAGAGLDGGTFIPKRWSAEQKRIIRESRQKAGGAVTAAIRQAANKPSLLLQASASGYYGTTLSDEVKTEESPPGEDFLAGICQLWEAATEPVEEMSLRRVLIRTGLVLDDDEGALPRLVLPFKLFAGGPLGSGEQYYPWIHLDDVVGAVRYLMEEVEADGPFNLSGPQPVTNREMARTLGRVLNRPSFLPAPAFALRLALGEVAEIVLKGQRMVPARLQAAGYTFRHPTLERSLEDLLV